MFQGNQINGTANNPVHFDNRCAGYSKSCDTLRKRLELVPYNISEAWAKYGDRLVHILDESPCDPSGSALAGNWFCSTFPDVDITIAAFEKTTPTASTMYTMPLQSGTLSRY